MNGTLSELGLLRAAASLGIRNSSIERAVKAFVSRSVKACMVSFGLVAIIGAAVPSRPDPTTQAAAYMLTMSDLMTAVIQPRHVKLGLAGQLRNWSYADYEASNLGRALGRLAKAVPTYRGAAIENMLSAFMGPPMNALASAVKAKDERAFVTAYEGLTAGCNQCHRATGHPMVIIRTPSLNSFSDQSFESMRTNIENP